MKLEQQCVSLELAKELKKLKINQNSLWMWVKYELMEEPRLMLSDINSKFKVACLSGKREYEYAAFTCAELGEMLPDKVEMADKGARAIYNRDYLYSIVLCYFPIDKEKIGRQYVVYMEHFSRQYISDWLRNKLFIARSSKEVDARASMLCYLKENKLIK